MDAKRGALVRAPESGAVKCGTPGPTLDGGVEHSALPFNLMGGGGGLRPPSKVEVWALARPPPLNV